MCRYVRKSSTCRPATWVLYSPVKIPSSPWFPTGSLCYVGHVSSGRQRGHLWVPEPMLSGPNQGKEAEAKGKRVAGNLARGQKGPWRQAAGKHSAAREGRFCGENPGSKVRKALHSPKGHLESHTCGQSFCTSTRTVFDWHVLTKFIRVYRLWRHTSKGTTLILLMFPCPHPSKVSHKILLNIGADKFSSLTWKSISSLKINRLTVFFRNGKEKYSSLLWPAVRENAIYWVSSHATSGILLSSTHSHPTFKVSSRSSP